MKSILKIGKKSGKMLIFGGPYSNLEATQALLDIKEQKKISGLNTICTGDICKHCSDPIETTNAIIKSRIFVVQGYCEELLGSESGEYGMGKMDNSSINEGYQYALKHLNKKTKKVDERTSGSDIF